jgi:hypothetical protein
MQELKIRTLQAAQSSSPLTIDEMRQLLIALLQDEQMQAILIQHFMPDVIIAELRRRRMPEPLLSTEDLAEILGITINGLYKKIQRDEIGIPYLPIGQGRKQGRRYDPRDVRAYIEKKKIHVVERPESLKRVKGRRKLERELDNSNGNGKGRREARG